MLLLKSLALLASFTTVVSALPAVTRGGRYLYTEDGTRFYVKGIAYQPAGNVLNDPNNPFPEPSDFVDPLADPAGCARDLPFLKQLGINAIRVYSVDSSKNHDDCMQALSQAGIYTIIDLSLPVNGSIDRTSPSWNVALLDLYLTTVSAFLKYDNILAFNIGNEVVAQTDQFPNATASAPYIKAAGRDVKAFLKLKNSKALVGYASTDGPTAWRAPLASFLGCGSEETAIDIYGLNNYEWCGDSTYQKSYSTSDGEFANLNIPAYFSEFGCVGDTPRTWTEVAALYGTDMNPHWSGGLVFSYFPAQGKFGMVTLSADNTTVTVSDEFNNLVAQYKQVSFINSPSQATAGATQFPQCAPPSPPGFLASNTLPPTPDAAACQCIKTKASTCTFKETNGPGQAAIVGSLLDTGCSLLGQQGGSCSPIGGSGSAGQYGALSFCDPITKLDYVFSSFYDITKRNPQSCGFSGNATVVPTPPSDPAAAASSCLSNAAATFTPTGPASTNAPASTGSAGGSPNQSGSGAPNSGSVMSIDITHGVVGFLLASVVAVSGGIWTVVA